MTKSTSCQLPPELEFIIIDNLFTDKLSLASCSLVCSRWLPTSRRHLFHHITIKAPVDPNPNPIAEFLDTIVHSGGDNMEWAIGPNIMKVTLDGDFWDQRSVLTCPLDLLCALMSQLPHLTSLYLKMVMLDDSAPNFPADRDQTTPFKLDELVIDRCSVQDHSHPRYLLALLSRFSSILSLTVHSWWVMTRDAMSSFLIDNFSAPTVHSLNLLQIGPFCARAIYALLAGPTSATHRSPARISFKGDSPEDFSAFSGFARVLGPAIQDLELQLDPHFPILDTMFSELSLSTCSALRSLVLGIASPVDTSRSSGQWYAEATRVILALNAQLLHNHCHVFSVLATLRLELRPPGSEMLDAFVRVTRNTISQPEAPTQLTRMVSADEAEQNRQVWTALEDALCAFPALERVELVLYELRESNEILTEEAKAELRTVLKRRLPRLGTVVQLISEAYVHRRF